MGEPGSCHLTHTAPALARAFLRAVSSGALRDARHRAGGHAGGPPAPPVCSGVRGPRMPAHDETT